MALSDERTAEDEQSTEHLQDGAGLVQNGYGKDQGDDDLQLDDRRRQVHAGGLIGAVVTVSAEQEMQKPDSGHPASSGGRELSEPSDFTRRDGSQQKAPDSDGDGNRHGLARGTRHYPAPDRGIVERKGYR